MFGTKENNKWNRDFVDMFGMEEIYNKIVILLYNIQHNHDFIVIRESDFHYATKS